MAHTGCLGAHIEAKRNAPGLQGDRTEPCNGGLILQGTSQLLQGSTWADPAPCSRLPLIIRSTKASPCQPLSLSWGRHFGSRLPQSQGPFVFSALTPPFLVSRTIISAFLPPSRQLIIISISFFSLSKEAIFQPKGITRGHTSSPDIVRQGGKSSPLCKKGRSGGL